MRWRCPSWCTSLGASFWDDPRVLHGWDGGWCEWEEMAFKGWTWNDGFASWFSFNPYLLDGLSIIACSWWFMAGSVMRISASQVLEISDFYFFISSSFGFSFFHFIFIKLSSLISSSCFFFILFSWSCHLWYHHYFTCIPDLAASNFKDTTSYPYSASSQDTYEIYILNFNCPFRCQSRCVVGTALHGIDEQPTCCDSVPLRP